MNVWMIFGAGLFVLLAIIHSALGEHLLLKPLFAAAAFQGHRLGRRFSERTFRFAWHLTSLAWVGFGAVLLWPAALPQLVAGVAVGSGAWIALASRGQHLAWPLFFLGGLSVLRAEHGLSGGLLGALSLGLGMLLVVIGLWHVYWALGGRRGLAVVLPEQDGKRLMNPGPVVTLVVTLGIFSFAGIAGLLGGWIEVPFPEGALRVAASLIGLVFLARTFGDLRAVGVLKRIRGTPYARWDDRLYSPLSFVLSAGFLLLATH